MISSNFHTHTIFCDGKNSPEEMVKMAQAKGFTALGFSGHAFTPCDLRYCMSEENTVAYREEVLRLKKTYQDQIQIFCGIEMDYFSKADTKDFDYVIGSVHYVEKDGVYYPIDDDEETFVKITNEVYGGDPYAFCEAYYKLMETVVETTNADFIGHFDLIAKFNEDEHLFLESHPRYVAAWKSAMEKLLKTKKPFEINTGAISRGYRTTPYPRPNILKFLKEQNAKILFSSDCHAADGLDCGFSAAEKLAKEAGFLTALTFSGADCKLIEYEL